MRTRHRVPVTAITATLLSTGTSVLAQSESEMALAHLDLPSR